MSALDHLTDAEIEACADGIITMGVMLLEAGLDPMKHATMTQRAWDGLQAVLVAVGAQCCLEQTSEGAAIAGAPDDDFARAAAEGN